MSRDPDPEKRVLLEAEGESGSVAETIRQEAERNQRRGIPWKWGVNVSSIVCKMYVYVDAVCCHGTKYCLVLEGGSKLLLE